MTDNHRGTGPHRHPWFARQGRPQTDEERAALDRLRRREDDQDADVNPSPPRPPARGTIDRVEGDRGYRPSASDLEGI